MLKSEHTRVPWTIFNTPSGKPASIANSASIKEAPEGTQQHSLLTKVTVNETSYEYWFNINNMEIKGRKSWPSTYSIIHAAREDGKKSHASKLSRVEKNRSGQFQLNLARDGYRKHSHLISCMWYYKKDMPMIILQTWELDIPLGSLREKVISLVELTQWFTIKHSDLN